MLTPVKTRVKMPDLNAEEGPSILLNKKGADLSPFYFWIDLIFKRDCHLPTDKYYHASQVQFPRRAHLE